MSIIPFPRQTLPSPWAMPGGVACVLRSRPAGLGEIVVRIEGGTVKVCQVFARNRSRALWSPRFGPRFALAPRRVSPLLERAAPRRDPAAGPESQKPLRNAPQRAPTDLKTADGPGVPPRRPRTFGSYPRFARRRSPSRPVRPGASPPTLMPRHSTSRALPEVSSVRHPVLMNSEMMEGPLGQDTPPGRGNDS